MHEFFPENLRNPARSRRAGLMRQFRSGQLYSKFIYSTSRLTLYHEVVNVQMYIQIIFTTVELTGTKLAHQARAAVVRGIS